MTDWDCNPRDAQEYYSKEPDNPVVDVRTTWCADDVRCHFEKDVDHMTDEEIMEELESLHGGFHDMCVDSGWDVIRYCFKVKEKE